MFAKRALPPFAPAAVCVWGSLARSHFTFHFISAPVCVCVSATTSLLPVDRCRGTRSVVHFIQCRITKEKHKSPLSVFFLLLLLPPVLSRYPSVLLFCPAVLGYSITKLANEPHSFFIIVFLFFIIFLRCIIHANTNHLHPLPLPRTAT